MTLPKPMRDLEGDEVKWFIDLDSSEVTDEEIDRAKKSLETFHAIKPRK